MKNMYGGSSRSTRLRLLGTFVGLLVTAPVFAQTSVGVYASPDLNRSPNYFINGKVNSQAGVTFGLMGLTGLSSRWSVLYGIQHASKRVASAGYLASLSVAGVEKPLADVIAVKQRQRIVELPLQLRYALSTESACLKPYVQAGVVGSWVLEAENEYTSKTGAAITKTLDVPTGFGFAPEVGVGVAYSLSKHLEFNLQPTLRLELDNSNTLSRVGLGTMLFYKF